MNSKNNKGPERVPLPDNIKMKIWIEAAGRCEFTNCNEKLWKNSLTGSITPWGQVAHVIGASRNGPRGRWNSPQLQFNPDNLMLMCPKCHKEIDYGKNIQSFPPKLLFQMKREHENRVRLLLDQDSKITRPVIISYPIGGNKVFVNKNAVRKAILPDYADVDEKWNYASLDKFERDALENWKYPIEIIDDLIVDLEKATKNNGIQHISIFGLAAQPILMYFGFRLGDKIPNQIYEPRRSKEPDNMWEWEKGGKSISFQINEITKTNSKDVLLLIALSDYISEDKYTTVGIGNPSIYEITIDSPVQGFLKRKADLEGFRVTARTLLNLIQKQHGKDCKIHVLPAMPASAAVQFGNLIQVTKDPEIHVYEFINKKFHRVLTLNQ